ncbi:hypothetical protein LCD36_04495 [Saccharopolyspora sp. 6T]|uniref:hypothetical protein n=1 Tax=Saccharopolyspora sp. 6T TaxID=2877238 RepID=UPI001CD26410|nr:hypothetical protein [Saccharopolyspora sp. 6T]MCA1185711.1 hypothetical protein [Saccharopolyspora sp. 6T]
MAELATYVHLVDADGNPHRFAPGETPPAWAAARITNPKAWKQGVTSTAATAPEQIEEPPRSGPGSNKTAWVAYAESRGVTITDDMGREDIIEAATRR